MEAPSRAESLRIRRSSRRRRRLLAAVGLVLIGMVVAATVAVLGMHGAGIPG